MDVAPIFLSIRCTTSNQGSRVIKARGPIGFGVEPRELKRQPCANCKLERALLGVPPDWLLQPTAGSARRHKAECKVPLCNR